MRIRIVLAVVVLVALAVPAYAQTGGELSQSDVDAALARRRAAGSSLEALTARFDQAMFDEEILREQIMDLSVRVADLEQDIIARRSKVVSLVVSRYMAGGLTGTERVFNTRDFTDIPVQAEYLARLNAADLAVLGGLLASEELQVSQQESLDASLIAQREITTELTEMATELSVALATADAEYNSIAAAFTKQEEERRAREEAERKAREEELRKAEAARKAREAAAAAAATTTTAVATTTTTTVPVTTTTTEAPQVTTTTEVTTTTSEASSTTDGSTSTTAAPPDTTTTTTAPPPPPAITDGKTCPVNAANSFSDTWGAARSGGRTHKGVDIFAARNAPLVAVESGTVTRTSNSSLGGISIYLTGSSGNRYYYAHLEFITDGIRGGTVVDVGETLGGVGTTGNAPAWLPMLHFQYAPPGGDWVNPYPLAKALCG